MSRKALLLLIASVFAVASPTYAHASPRVQTCQFVQGFAAFREDLGAEIVGDCLTDQTFTERGDAIQETTNGVLEWAADQNSTTFLAQDRTWFAGTGGLRGPVRLSGMAGMAASHSVAAVDLLSRALLTGGDLPPPYQPYSQRLTVPGELTTVRQCSDQLRASSSHTLGGVQIGFVDQERSRAVSHRLWALQEGHGEAAYQAIARFYMECPPEGVSTVERAGQPVQQTARRTVEPMSNIGDAAIRIRQETALAGVSGRYIIDINVVRYGDVVSVVSASPPQDQLVDGLLPKVDAKLRDVVAARETNRNCPDSGHGHGCTSAGKAHYSQVAGSALPRLWTPWSGAFSRRQ